MEGYSQKRIRERKVPGPTGNVMGVLQAAFRRSDTRRNPIRGSVEEYRGLR